MKKKHLKKKNRNINLFIQHEPSILHEASKEDEASMICEESIKDEQPIVWDIPTPTSDGTNYEDEDASIPTEEECPLDLTTKDKKQQSEIQHIPLLTERRKTILDPKEDVGLILTIEQNEYDKQNPMIDDTTVVTIKSRKPFPTWLYENINAQYVEQIPDLINGLKLYVVNTTLEDYSDSTADLRYFDMKTSSKAKYAGIQKGGICQGSWECPNPHCTCKALSVNNQLNRVSWLNVRGYKNLKICDSCQCMAQRQGCGARKFVDFNPWTNIAQVYHMGTHTCTPQLETWRKKKRMAKILQTVDSQTNISGKEIAVNQVEKMLETGTMAEVHNEAGLWINYRRNKQVMNDAVPSVPKDENSFDAVAIIKRKTNEYDPYYIYRVNNGLCNNMSDYVSLQEKWSELPS